MLRGILVSGDFIWSLDKRGSAPMTQPKRIHHVTYFMNRVYGDFAECCFRDLEVSQTWGKFVRFQIVFDTLHSCKQV